MGGTATCPHGGANLDESRHDTALLVEPAGDRRKGDDVVGCQAEAGAYAEQDEQLPRLGDPGHQGIANAVHGTRKGQHQPRAETIAQTAAWSGEKPHHQDGKRGAT